MKKTILFCLAVMLLLTGCNKEKNKDLAVEDALCPYEITHKKESVQIQLQLQQLPDAQWQATAAPDDICAVAQEMSKDGEETTVEITGTEEGLSVVSVQAAELTGEVRFTLDVTVQVDAEGIVTVVDATHREVQKTEVASETLPYRWEVDMDGVLTLSFPGYSSDLNLNTQNTEICEISGVFYGPGGCSLDATPLQPGTATVVLEDEQTQQTITVTLSVDEQLQIAVVSVEG